MSLMWAAVEYQKEKSHFKQFQNINGTVFKAEILTFAAFKNTMNVRNGKKL